jgi:RimJ/RimL family protein N-acetyltransferase
MPSFVEVSLRTERLLLRPLRELDAPALFSIFSDPKVMRYWSTPPWAGIGKAYETIADDARALAAGEHLRLGIVRIRDAQLIGTCSLFNLVPESRRAELGYGLAHAAWGQGFMHEALVALLDYGFTELLLHRVEADIDPRNEASARSLARLGFKKEGHLRDRWVVGGEVSDSALYGLLRGEWAQRSGVPGSIHAPRTDGHMGTQTPVSPPMP